MSEGYDGQELVKILAKYLSKNASLLELGMGPGKDLLLLAEDYRVTGSDSSQVFIDRFHEQNPKIEALVLDAVTLDTHHRFDCIYSNKVLHHLSKEGLAKSLHRQYDLLTEGGIAMHSFWYGDKEEFYDDLRFVYYKEELILDLVKEVFEVVAVERYTEFEEDDSFYIIVKKADN